MYCHCCTNDRAPRWTFTDPCKPEMQFTFIHFDIFLHESFDMMQKSFVFRQLNRYICNRRINPPSHARRQKSMKGGSTRKASRPPRNAMCSYGRGSGAAQGPQKLWGIWCKILHSSNLETPNFSLKKFHFFIAYFNISHKMFIKDIFFLQFF